MNINDLQGLNLVGSYQGEPRILAVLSLNADYIFSNVKEPKLQFISHKIFEGIFIIDGEFITK